MPLLGHRQGIAMKYIDMCLAGLPCISNETLSILNSSYVAYDSMEVKEDSYILKLLQQSHRQQNTKAISKKSRSSAERRAMCSLNLVYGPLNVSPYLCVNKLRDTLASGRDIMFG